MTEQVNQPVPPMRMPIQGEPHKPHRRMPIVFRVLLSLIALLIVIAVLLWVDTSQKSDWLYQQSAYIDSLYSQEERLLEDMAAFTGMLPPQRTDWSEQDKLSFDTLNQQKIELYNEIDKALMDYNVNLTLWTEPLLDKLENPWAKNSDSSLKSSN